MNLLNRFLLDTYVYYAYKQKLVNLFLIIYHIIRIKFVSDEFHLK